MEERKLPNRQDDPESEAAPPADGIAVVEEQRKGSTAWLFGAYTFLFLWGITYLVLFFTDRLPV